MIDAQYRRTAIGLGLLRDRTDILARARPATWTARQRDQAGRALFHFLELGRTLTEFASLDPAGPNFLDKRKSEESQEDTRKRRDVGVSFRRYPAKSERTIAAMTGITHRLVAKDAAETGKRYQRVSG
jgi:hypothetical protein